jgi:hypothetical protein
MLLKDNKTMTRNWSYVPPDESNEPVKDKQVCECGNDTFRMYCTTIVDDLRAYCSKCGKSWF